MSRRAWAFSIPLGIVCWGFVLFAWWGVCAWIGAGR